MVNLDSYRCLVCPVGERKRITEMGRRDNVTSWNAGAGREVPGNPDDGVGRKTVALKSISIVDIEPETCQREFVTCNHPIGISIVVKRGGVDQILREDARIVQQNALAPCREIRQP